jgi:hypothetical protein
MDNRGCKTEEEILEMIEMIEDVEKCMLENDYENAFSLFLLYIGRLDPDDRDSFIIHFKNFARKMSLSKIKRPI